MGKAKKNGEQPEQPGPPSPSLINWRQISFARLILLVGEKAQSPACPGRLLSKTSQQPPNGAFPKAQQGRTGRAGRSPGGQHFVCRSPDCLIKVLNYKAGGLPENII